MRQVSMYKVKAWLYLMRKKGLEKKIGDTLPIYKNRAGLSP
jgi:hypothetical protein